MLNTKTLPWIAGVIIAILATLKGIQVSYENEIQDLKTKYKDELIAQDDLKKLNDSLYQRIVQDNKTKRELRDLADSLELELNKPVSVTDVGIKPKDETGDIEDVEVEDSIVTFSDKYPKKGETFVTYRGTINTNTKESEGTFEFEEAKISLGIEQREDGVYFVKTKVPSYLEITDVQVKSLPIDPPPAQEPDKFGYLVGAGLGVDYRNNTQFMTLSAGVRINNIYIEAIGGSNQTLSAGVKFEF